MSTSKYADEGTIAHALAALCLESGKDAAAFVGRIIESEDYEHSKLSPSNAHRWMRCAGSFALEKREPFKPRKFNMGVTDAMAADVQVYVDNIREYAAGKEMMVEVKLDISRVIDVPDHSGTGDVAILDYAAAEIQAHDLKFGRGVEVLADENEQLMIYALALLELFEALEPEGGWKRVRLVIHQPRINPKPSEWSCSVEELRAFGERVKAAARLALDTAEILSDVNLVPGEKQCRFCSAKATCPALGKQVMEAVLGDFENLDEASPVEVPDDAVALARYLKLLPLIETWCKAVAAHAESEALAGKSIPGFKLVVGRRGNRAWGDADQVEALMKSFRLKQEQMYSFTLISPTDAEKLLKKEQPKRWAKLQGHITQSDGKTTLVPATDSRPAIEVKPVADDFSNLNAEELV